MWVDVAFLSHVASRLVGQRCVVFPERQPGQLGSAEYNGKCWELVLDPSIVRDEHQAMPFAWAFCHEVAHVVLGHCAPRYISDSDRAAARVKYAADMPAILERAAQNETAANAWATAVVPVLESWCQQTYGRTFADLARNGTE